MSTKYFCDRCGGEIKEMPLQKLTLKKGDFSSLNKDLCADCVTKLNDWMARPHSISYYSGGVVYVNNPYTTTSDNRNQLNCIGNPTVACDGKPSFTTP